ncbi:magnesium/cobalt transporter CorA [Bacillus songklensis]|uniref:Magnesium transport protein CorA n=1 Tax=Bacillus songklensis TaxID=1069116 RepID=A0ABV8B7V9_9BACI
MIRSIAVTNDSKLIQDVPLERLLHSDIKWYWVDFSLPTEEESKALHDFFHFHPLAIEDCFHFLQRPKLDYYEGYNFLVLHSLNPKTLLPEELDIFWGDHYLVTFHLESSMEIKTVWERMLKASNTINQSVVYVLYQILDKVVDQYFPSVYRIEDSLIQIEAEETANRGTDELFQIRKELLRLRRTVFPMRDLLYRILESERIQIPKKNKAYFKDIYDHLLKLAESIESNRELTTDIRDSYISLNSNRMNSIMMTLTVITTIFMPLTFIAGIYGMNFEYMPELTWRYSYFIVLGVMVVIGLSMFWWFKAKGWFKSN